MAALSKGVMRDSVTGYISVGASDGALEGSKILKRPRQEQSSARRRSSNKSAGQERKRRGARIAGPILIACAVVAVLFMADNWANSGKIYRGVEVAGVSLGGMTTDEAQRAVEERSTGALREVNISGPENFTFTSDEMGLDYDVRSTVEEAYSIGRSGGLGSRISDRLEVAYGTVEVEPIFDYDPEAARRQVQEISSSLDARPQEASVEVVGSAVEVGDGTSGYRTDVERTLASVNGAIEDMSGEAEIVGEVLRPELTTAEARSAANRARTAMDGQLSISGENENWTVSPAAIGESLDISSADGDFRVDLNPGLMRRNLENIYASVNQPAVEAGYEVNGTDVSVTESQQGQQIQNEQFMTDLRQGIFEGQRDFDLPVTVDRPQMTTEQAQQMRPRELLGEYSTNYLTYDDTPGRVTNLQVGSGAVNGQLVAPGEVFSFNDLASQYEYESGGVIVNGQVDEADGGGLCQVSSTLYMAANYAGLDIVERHPHFAELPYIQPGFDATVWFGALDMKFENTTDGYILIEETVDTETGDVYSAIYGVPQDVEVEMTSEKVGQYPGEEGKPTTEWVTYQTVTRNGEVEYDGVYHEDTYEYLQPSDDS